MEEVITIILVLLPLLTIFCLYKMLDKRGIYFTLIINNILGFIIVVIIVPAPVPVPTTLVDVSFIGVPLPGRIPVVLDGTGTRSAVFLEDFLDDVVVRLL